MEKFGKISQEIKVLSKVTSEDKYLLVAGLEQLDNIVATALSADNMEDLAILAKADVGITMKGNGIK